MLRDVFYYGKKPNVHPREKPATSLDHAREQATTDHFWIINEFCNYKDFDWDFDFQSLPNEDVWAEEHNNVWPSLYQKDSGTWLCSKFPSTIVIYRADVPPLKRKAILDERWVIDSEVDISKFDFAWHPDPTEPLYIYRWGSKFCPVEIKSYIEYKTPGAVNIKYMTDTVELLPEKDRWVLNQEVDTNKFDLTWRPDPREPPFIYIWGNKFIDGRLESTLEYHVPGATAKKYMDDPVPVVPQFDRWKIYQEVDHTKFDLSWRPDPREPPFIYVWGNKHISGELKPTLEYHTPNATNKKYMDELVEVLPLTDCWIEHQAVDKNLFDMSWRPDPREPPFIYVWGNKYIPGVLTPTIEFNCPGAKTKKFMEEPAAVLPQLERWNIVQQIDEKYYKNDSIGFNLTWRPDPAEPPFIYVWGNKYIPANEKSTLEYHVPGATKIKYMDELIDVAPEWDKWVNVLPVDKEKSIQNGFDFSWRPDPKEPPYVYTWGNKFNDATIQPTLEYHCEGATERKYMGNDVEILPDWNNWNVLHQVDRSSFDFSWRPDPTSPPFIYVFGNQHHDGKNMPTLEYHVPGAKNIKYVDDLRAELLPNPDRYEHLDYCYGIDYSWVPNPNDPPYIYAWGNQWNKPEDKISVQYRVIGATEYKYMSERAIRKPTMDNWIVPANVDTSEFDFSWEPNPKEPPYIYQFGTQWQKTGGPKYVVPGATEVKYVDTLKAKALPDKNRYSILENYKIKDFDYSWHPDATEPPYIYIFGNNYYPAQKMPTIKYTVPGATEIKYVINNVATLRGDKTNWTQLLAVDETKFDYSWIPDPNEPPYIYIFGNKWNDPYVEPTVEYRVEGATEKKYIDFLRIPVLPDPLLKDNWIVPENLDTSNFDFSWRPDPREPALIYQFGTQWQKTGGPRFVMPEAKEIKYIDTLKATRLPVMDKWIIAPDIDVSTFDFSWHPDDTAPHAIYQFGTLENDNDGPRYMATVEEFKTIDDLTTFDDTDTICGDGFGNTKIDYPVIRLLRTYKKDTVDRDKVKVNKYQIRTTLEELIDEHPDEVFWALNKNIDYAEFDFNWRPNIEQARYIHVFGSPESAATHTYFVSAKMYKQGYKDYNFIEKDKKADSEYLSKLFKKNDMFFIDRGNSESAKRFEELSKKHPNLQKTRFLNTWVDTVNRCIKKASTQLIWILNSELDYTDFDFDYYPNPWQFKMVHIFGTQWNHWGTTFLINCETFPEDTKYVKIIEHLQNINFVKDRRAKTTNNLHDIYLIDHGNNETGKVFEILSKKVNDRKVHKVKFDRDYFTTLKTLLKNIPDKKENYIWLCNSICDYTNFDFSYVPDPFARDNLHVFASNKQKFGDTFLIDVNTVKELIEYMNELNEYTKLNFNNHQKVSRLPAPVFTQKTDTHVGGLDVEFDFPYAIFKTEDVESVEDEPISFWSNESKNILITSTGATQIMVPKEAKDYVKKELYDYPYIKTVSKVTKSKPLDIVFLSNGEKQAESNYQHLLRCVAGRKNKIVRVDGVNGRVQAYHAAANASDTAWMFTVFAKLRIDKDFDWDWQPDRLQVAKHYIFNAYNPLNGLEYGHQGMIAYNKNLVLNNKGLGLDFTLDDPHESVNVLSGTANFNTDPYSTWRTAFREVIKLQSAYDDVSKERLKVWLIDAKGEYSKHCLLGAHDAVEYYQSVHGDITKLKLSYEWKWLQDYYNKKYK